MNIGFSFFYAFYKNEFLSEKCKVKTITMNISMGVTIGGGIKRR